jgi:hypothetical protein
LQFSVCALAGFECGNARRALLVLAGYASGIHEGGDRDRIYNGED